MKLTACVLIAMLGLGTAAHASSAFDLYEAGKYDDAIVAGHAQNDATGFALAARAELAAEMMRAEPCLDCLKRAEADARKAIAADPKLPDAHVFLAVTLGHEARLIGIIMAQARGNAAEAKHNLEAALAADPSNAFAMAAFGGWNIEVVHGGGAPMARLFYGASVDKGLALFAKAFAAAPDNTMLRYQYALTLSGYDLDTYRANVEDALTRTVNGKPHGAYEIFVQGRAKELLAALKANDRDKFRALLKRDQGYP